MNCFKGPHNKLTVSELDKHLHIVVFFTMSDVCDSVGVTQLEKYLGISCQFSLDSTVEYYEMCIRKVFRISPIALTRKMVPAEIRQC